MPPIRLKPNNPIVQFIKNLMFLGLENFGKYYSCYRAFVSDNDDPECLQRVKLVIPQITGNEVHEYWAFPRNIFYGRGYGMQIVPQKGDVVWVEFEGGCPEVPVWSHGHPGRRELPKDEQLKDKNCYWFVTPKGHKVLINDTKNTIHIEHRLGDVVELNSEGIDIVGKGSRRISVKNGQVSLKALLQDILLMYMKTQTIDGKPLNPSSIKKATDLIKNLNKLLR